MEPIIYLSTITRPLIIRVINYASSLMRDRELRSDKPRVLKERKFETRERWESLSRGCTSFLAKHNLREYILDVPFYSLQVFFIEDKNPHGGGGRESGKEERI